MVHVLLELDKEGALCSFEASGHAHSGAKGHDIVCAAVTVLLRTSIQALSSVRAEVNAAERGLLSFRVVQYDKSQYGKLQYAAEFLWQGMDCLQQEYPQAVKCKKIQR